MKHPAGYALCLTLVAAMAVAVPALAADITVVMRKVTQEGTSTDIGTIVISGSEAGATLKLNLHGLPPGPHGFHVHENGNCSPTLMNGTRIPGGAAGSHLDPDHTYEHEGPTGEGHLGDLPVLVAEPDGTATQTLTAPRIKDIDALKLRALVIHAGGDTYSDSPNPLGGGGGRIACGVIE
jgi:Cu-Zn family superoxide dismutase